MTSFEIGKVATLRTERLGDIALPGTHKVEETVKRYQRILEQDLEMPGDQEFAKLKKLGSNLYAEDCLIIGEPGGHLELVDENLRKGKDVLSSLARGYEICHWQAKTPTGVKVTKSTVGRSVFFDDVESLGGAIAMARTIRRIPQETFTELTRKQKSK